MNKKELKAFKHFISAYKLQWDLNRYAREDYDEALEYYLGYRPQNRYPLLYNESFNKLLPKTTTILSRLMDQIYQAGTSDLVSVRPRSRKGVDSAPRVQALLNYQLETLNDVDTLGGSYLFNKNLMFNAVNFGKGIGKLYWRKEERIMPKRQQIPVPKFDEMGNVLGMEYRDIRTDQMQTVYDAPYAEVIHNKMFVPHPLYKNIQLMPNVFCVYRKSMDHVKRLADKGIYIKKNLKDLGWGTSTHNGTDYFGDSGEAYAKTLSITGGISAEEINSERIAPEIDIIEGYGRYIFPEDEGSYEVGSGMKIKGMESEAIVHIGNYSALLSIQKNTYGQRPFIDIGCYHNPETYWDIGLIDLGKGIQEQYNTLANTRMQNAMMLVNNMLKVREDANIDPAALVWKPFGIVPVEEMTDVESLQVADMGQSQVFREQEQFFDETLQDMTGMYAYNMGQTPQRQENVGTIYSIQSMGEARTKLLLMTMDHTGFRPMLKYMMLLNAYHLPPDFEARINTSEGTQFTPLFAGDIHVDYDFSARYTGMEPALGKNFRAERLLQLAMAWKDSPFLQQHQWMKAILELMDFADTDKYLNSPQQMQQEQQQMQQAQFMAAAREDQAAISLQEKKNEGAVLKQLIS